MILSPAEILEERLVAAELPQGLSCTALGNRIEGASDKGRQPRRLSCRAGKDGGKDGCGHGLISNGSVLSPFSVPLLSLMET
jgi:hypothetical protein